MARYPLAPEFAKLAVMRGVPHSPTALRFFQSLPVPGCRARGDLNVTKLCIEGHRGGAVRTWLIEPKEAEGELPCIIYYHGGGFIMHIQPYMFGIARRWAAALGCKVVVPEYRLAPSHPFPTAAEDAFSAYLWTRAHAGELGIDAGRIIVAGDSAGGNLAAAVCLMARDRGYALPCFQLLLYPTCDRRLQAPSSLEFADTPVWNSRLSKAMWELYLGTSDEDEIFSMEGLCYASPQEATSHAGLPDAYVEVCEFDSLRDEGLAYAESLRAAGSDVEVRLIEGAPHGADLAGHTGPIMRSVTEQRLEALRRALG